MILEETSRVIWISGRKLRVFLVVFLVFTSLASASHYYDEASGSIEDETGFEVPQYDSQGELLAELVAPFLFLTVLLNFVMMKVLSFVLGSKEEYPSGAYPYGIHAVEGRPDVRKYSIIMSIAITGMLVPTPFWQYMVGAIRLIGATSLLVFAGIVGFVLYLMAKN